MSKVDCILRTADVIKRRSYMQAMDDVMNFLNSLDSSEMSPKEVRSAVYSFCMEARP